MRKTGVDGVRINDKSFWVVGEDGHRVRIFMREGQQLRAPVGLYGPNRVRGGMPASAYRFPVLKIVFYPFVIILEMIYCAGITEYLSIVIQL